MNSSTSLTGYIAYLWSYSIVASFVEAERVSRCSSHRKARRKALAWLVEGCSYSAAAVVVARASAASTTTTVSGSLRVMQLSSNSCCNTEDEVLLKTLKMLRPQPQKTVKAEEEQEEGGGGEEETEEDLICDAVENGEASKEGTEAACLQGCISSCFGALQDLRKVKVSEMVHQKVANSIISAAASENNEPILETVIEREDSIQKSTLDTYSYRYNPSRLINFRKLTFSHTYIVIKMPYLLFFITLRQVNIPRRNVSTKNKNKKKLYYGNVITNVKLLSFHVDSILG